MNEDRAKPYDADDAFDPIVESLLKYPLDSREFTEAAQVATAADVAEAMRQFEQTIAAFKARNAKIDLRLDSMLEDD